MKTTTYSPAHPIVFIFDFSNDAMEVPSYESEEVASANESCVSIRTIADVDGDVTVMLGETLPSDAMTAGVEVFRGSIRAPSGKVAIVTSENQRLLELDITGREAVIRIVVDDEAHPSIIWVEARESFDQAKLRRPT